MCIVASAGDPRAQETRSQRHCGEIAISRLGIETPTPVKQHSISNASGTVALWREPGRTARFRGWEYK